MPAPPIAIGELIDVPAPDSPIASAWAQEVSHRVTHRFVSVAARDAAYPAATAGAGALCVVGGGALHLSDGVGWIVLAEPPVPSVVYPSGTTEAWPSGVISGHTIFEVQSIPGTYTSAGGTQHGQFQRAGGICFFEAAFTYQASHVIDGMNINLPVPGEVPAGYDWRFQVAMLDSGSNFYQGVALSIDHSKAGLFCAVTSSTFIRTQAIASGGSPAPFTWTTGDRILVSGWYPMQSRYS